MTLEFGKFNYPSPEDFGGSDPMVDDEQVTPPLDGKEKNDRAMTEGGRRMLLTPTGKEISRAYDRAAQTFLEHRRDPNDKFNLLAWPSLSVMINGGLKDAVVADLGCGPGEVTRRFLDLPGKPRVVHGYDASKGMIEIARKRFPDPRLDLQLTNMESLPLEDGSVDLVVATYSMLHVVNLQGALQEIQRVLVTGGRALILEPHEQRFQYYYQQAGGKGYFQEGWYLETFPGLESDEDNPEYVPTYYRTTRRWIREITDAGLEFVDYHEPKPNDLMIERNHPVWQDYQKCLRMIIYEARKI